MTTLFPGDNNDQQHLFLATGNNLGQARQQTIHFINTTQLIVYQSNTIKDEEIRSASSTNFWMEIEKGIAANHRFCRDLLKELQDTGLTELEDLLCLQLGYPSKVLHILTHMLDGFIGTDSVFYNLVEDSHWLSETLRATIQQKPESYWLIPVWHGTVTSSLLHLGKENPK
ncbi:MAG: hypothetical protein Q7U88_03845 [Desulfocapsaceae bacterium]|nr:hypothetical protein [Desulfocapsaceae bacterium]